MTDPDIPLGWRVTAAVRLTGGLGRLGILPTARTIHRLPVAKRKATKPAWWMTGPLPAGVHTVESEVPGGEVAVPVRRYHPDGAAGPLPLLLYIHGGGWVTGGLDAAHHLCAQLAAGTRATVVSVDYRLAPESPYPAALADCRSVLCWLAEHGASVGGDPGRLAVAGDSAGGNLAAALCLLARRDGLPMPIAQVLVYPGLDLTLSSPSMVADRQPGLTRADCAAMAAHYLGAAEPRDPLVSPLLAENLAGLPPALIMTADRDVLRDDGRRYADRLAAAGVPVRYTNYLGMPHGFFSMPRLCRSSPQALAEVVQELSAAFAAARERVS